MYCTRFARLGGPRKDLCAMKVDAVCCRERRAVSFRKPQKPSVPSVVCLSLPTSSHDDFDLSMDSLKTTVTWEQRSDGFPPIISVQHPFIYLVVGFSFCVPAQ